MILLALHAATTWIMTGVIWFVQVVHYPLLSRVGANFTEYESEHVRRTMPLAASAMIAELLLAMWIALRPPATLPLWMPYTGFALLLFLWATTFFVMVPLHNLLSREQSQANVTRLVNFNWWRTLAWSLRGVLAVVMIVKASS